MSENFVRDNMTRSTSPSSFNSLQIALMSMTDRCTKQQKQIDDLEKGKKDLYIQLKKMHEENVKLREKNVSLSHEVHTKSKKLSEVQECWNRDKEMNESNVKQLEKLQQEMLGFGNKHGNRSFDSFDMDSTNDNISSLDTTDVQETEVSSSIMNNANDEIKTHLDTSKQGIGDIKDALLQQQSLLKSAIEAMKQRKTVSDQSAERLIAAVLTTVVSRSGIDNVSGVMGSRVCPMCEAVFPDTCPHDEFETHVVEHFSYEESETLRQFDTVPDAYWPGIEHNPEM